MDLSSSLKLNNNLVPKTTINPPTAPMKIAAKKVAKFKPGKALAESVNGKKRK